MPNSLTLQDPSGNDAWQLSVDASGRLIFSDMESGGWVEKGSIEPLTGLMNAAHLTVNRKPGMPFQKGLSIGCAPKNQLGSAGEDYIKMFSDDPLEEYMQVNFGMHTDPDGSKRIGFWECIEQHTRALPCVVDPQNQSSFGVGAIPDDGVKMQVKTIDDATSSTTTRVAIRIDGGTLANGWERLIEFTGNGASVVAGTLAGWLSGLERRLRIKANGVVAAEAHENGTFTHG